MPDLTEDLNFAGALYTMPHDNVGIKSEVRVLQDVTAYDIVFQ